MKCVELHWKNFAAEECSTGVGGCPLSQSSCQIGNQGFGPATQSLDAGGGVELRARLVGEPTNDLQSAVVEQSRPDVEAPVGRGEARQQVRGAS